MIEGLVVESKDIFGPFRSFGAPTASKLSRMSMMRSLRRRQPPLILGCAYFCAIFMRCHACAL